MDRHSAVLHNSAPGCNGPTAFGLVVAKCSMPGLAIAGSRGSRGAPLIGNVLM